MKNRLINILRICFYFFMKPFLWLYIVIFQHVRFKRNGMKIPKGPVLFLSNHLTNWDGIYLNCMFFTRIIRFIVHDELFKNKAVAWFSKNLLGEVCRGKTEESVLDILEMRKLAKSGATLGLYPEGDIDMFGRTLPIEISIAKFVRLLNVPVVLMKIQGAYIRAPRWAKKARHSHITYSITNIISLDELKKSSLDDLYKRILDGITVDDNKYQSEFRYRQFWSMNRAKWLELGLFYCPKCKKFETLYSKKDNLICNECGIIAKYNRYSMLESKCDNFNETLLTSWDDEQKRVLYSRLDFCDENTVILFEKELDYYCVKKTEYFKKPICRANLVIYKEKIEIEFENDKKTIFIKNIDKAKLQYKDVLEIHYNDDCIRFRNKNKKWSAYLYALTINYLLKINAK